MRPREEYKEVKGWEDIEWSACTRQVPMGTAQIRAVDGVPFGAAGIDPAVAAHPHILVRGGQQSGARLLSVTRLLMSLT